MTLTSTGDFGFVNFPLWGRGGGSANFPLRKTQAKNTRNSLKGILRHTFFSIFKGWGVIYQDMNNTASKLSRAAILQLLSEYEYINRCVITDNIHIVGIEFVL